jgi:hypothetical protein
MKTKIEEKPALADQLNELSVKFDMLAAKQEAAALAAMNFTRELDELRIKFRAVAEQLGKREVEESSLDIWQYIGEGG